MATVTREAALDAGADECFDALRDFGAVHERLAPGFVTGCQLTGPTVRRVTFFNGAVVTEELVAIDEARRRLVYTLTDGLPTCTFYGAAAQVVPEGEGRCRFVWTLDVLPDELEPRLAAMMDRGIDAIAATLGSGPAGARTPVGEE
jgi:Polyketide cyclase / dehydrase and lipid transport